MSSIVEAAARYLKAVSTKHRPRQQPSLSIETTSACNSDCVFCPNSDMARKRESMPIDLFQNIVVQFAKMGGGNLDLTTVIGEPLLDRHLLERIKHVKTFPNVSGVGFVTTLQHLDRFDPVSFLTSGLDWITVSTALWGEKAYREFFRVPLYQRMIKNLITLLTTNRDRGYPLTIFFSLKPTGHLLDEILKHDDFKQVQTLYGDGLIRAAEQISNRVDDWNASITLPDHLTLRPKLPRTFTPCERLYEGLRVYSNGSVGACACRDYEANSDLILGDASNGLKNLWEGEGLKAIRRNWRVGLRIPDLCRNCRDFKYTAESASYAPPQPQ